MSTPSKKKMFTHFIIFKEAFMPSKKNVYTFYNIQGSVYVFKNIF